MICRFFSVLAVAAAALAGAANAQATRTWVSGVGDDANPCSRTAPCKTFAGAISKTAAKGEINVLDPGAFGTVTITKSISIVSAGEEAGVLATAGGSGIVVNAGANDEIQLTGLDIEGIGTANNGVRILGAGSVYIKDTTISDMLLTGVDVQSQHPIRVYLDNVSIYDATVGVQVKSPSAVNENRAFIYRSMLSNNSTTGIKADGTKSVAVVSDSHLANGVTGNLSDLLKVNGGTIVSHGNNVIRNGTPSSTDPLK